MSRLRITHFFSQVNTYQVQYQYSVLFSKSSNRTCQECFRMSRLVGLLLRDLNHCFTSLILAQQLYYIGLRELNHENQTAPLMPKPLSPKKKKKNKSRMFQDLPFVFPNPKNASLFVVSKPQKKKHINVYILSRKKPFKRKTNLLPNDHPPRRAGSSHACYTLAESILDFRLFAPVCTR